MNETPVVIIYDSSCSLCCGGMKWIRLHAIKEELFEFIPCKSGELKCRFPEISEQDCLEALHVVLSDRKILVGEKALPEILSRLRIFKWLAVLFTIPVINVFSYALYRIVADNRYVISRTILPLTQENR